MKPLLLTILICLFPLLASAGESAPFLGDHYKNITWVEHIWPYPPLTEGEEIDSELKIYAGQLDIGKVDLDVDDKYETIKVIWSPGVSNKLLTIELYRDGVKFDTLKPPFSSHQPNFKLEDVDGNGKLEIIIWTALWDFRLPDEDGVKPGGEEGHSSPHRYIIATYKLLRGEYCLWDIYTTKNKYEPFFHWPEKGLPK